MLDLLILVEDIGHFVEEVRGQEGDASLGRGAHGAKLGFILDREGASRQSLGNVDLLHILAVIGIDLLPFVDKGALGGVLGEDANLLL